jgi:fatty acid desaturase
MQDRNIKKMIWMAYAMPAIPLLVYTAANLAAGSWRIVICSIMFVVFVDLVWFTAYAVHQLRQERLFDR